jgi:GDSL-like Lipase/Acylhydrolase family
VLLAQWWRRSANLCRLLVPCLLIAVIFPLLGSLSARAAGPAQRSLSTVATNSSVFTVAAPLGEAAGDVLIGALQLNGSGTVTAPSGWALIGSTSSGGDVTYTYDKVAGTNEPGSYTWTSTTYSNGSLAILDYTGIDTTTPVNAWAGNSGIGSALAPAVTTTTSTVSVVVVTWDGGPSNLMPTASSDYAQRWFLHSYEWTYGADSLTPAAAGARPAVVIGSTATAVYTAQQIALTVPTSTPTPTPTPTPPSLGFAAMPLISRDLPAYSVNGVYPASYGNDADYATQYRGTPTTSLSYDLSGVPPTHRSQILVAWYNNSSPWDAPAINGAYYNNPRDYTIDASAAPGGATPPISSWVNLVTITGNPFNARQHVVNFSGYNWLRINVTAVNGSPGNADAAFNLDVHDASAATTDTWAFFGDSITQDDMGHADARTADGLHNFAQLVNAGKPGYFPSFLDAGVGGWDAGSPLRNDPASGQSFWSEFVAATPAHFVSLDFGTNDANERVDPATFKAELLAMISTVEAAGKIPVLRLIPWGCTSAIQASGPLLNQQIQALWAADPTIVHGPDYWTYYSQHQDLISSDCIHPSLPDGALAYRQQYAQTMVATVYTGS